MHLSFTGVLGSLKKRLEHPEEEEPWSRLEKRPDPRNRLNAIEERLDGDVDGHGVRKVPATGERMGQREVESAEVSESTRIHPALPAWAIAVKTEAKPYSRGGRHSSTSTTTKILTMS